MQAASMRAIKQGAYVGFFLFFLNQSPLSQAELSQTRSARLPNTPYLYFEMQAAVTKPTWWSWVTALGQDLHLAC
jgi:hypothetical protein